MSRPESKKQALEAIVTRSAVDWRFRQQLLADPRRAILEAFGVQIPAHVRIKFVEREPGLDALVVLPDFKGGRGGELTDRDLEAVTGGVPDADLVVLAEGVVEGITWSDPIEGLEQTPEEAP